MQQALWKIMRQEELRVDSQVPIQKQTPLDYEPMVKRLQQYLNCYLNEYIKLTPYINQNRRIDYGNTQMAKSKKNLSQISHGTTRVAAGSYCAR